ncbi:MAG TPA: hypothetical protein VGS59_05185 [Candidatus Acidoferrales bacterium]|nr:hypothetical protein [Candidatus Acidoferrales bacterium]
MRRTLPIADENVKRCRAAPLYVFDFSVQPAASESPNHLSFLTTVKTAKHLVMTWHDGVMPGTYVRQPAQYLVGVF